MQNSIIGKVQLPDDMLCYLQTLDFEIGGLKVLHTHALSAGLPSKKTKKIRKRFQDKFNEYQLAKEMLHQMYGGNYPAAKRWWVNFQEGVMYFAG